MSRHGNGAAPQPADARKEDALWAAFTSTQQHYESELNLFGSRNNIFLLTNSGVLGFESVLWQGHDAAILWNVAAGGLLLCLIWFAVALSSYWWLAHWRAHLERLGYSWLALTGVAPFITQMDMLRAPKRRLRWLKPVDPGSKERISAEASQQTFVPVARPLRGLMMALRPSILTFALPVGFAAGYLLLALSFE